MKNHQKFISKFVTLAVCGIFVLTGCSNRLPAETTIAVNYTVETSESTTVTETLESTEIIESLHGPSSTPIITMRPFDEHGKLSISDGELKDSNDEAFQFFGVATVSVDSNFEFFNSEIAKTLAQDWGCSVVKIAVKPDGEYGYSNMPDEVFATVCSMIDYCSDCGIYVIVSWNCDNSVNPEEYEESATSFFSRLATLYCEEDFILYEVCGCPGGMCVDEEETSVDFNNTIRSYASSVLSTIRDYDSDGIVICGITEADIADKTFEYNPIYDDYLMYSFSFAAGTDGQELRDNLQSIIDDDVPMICTSFVITDESGAGELFTDEANTWFAFMNDNSISWCYQDICGAEIESSNALLYESNVLTDEEKLAGHWPDEFISTAGLFIRSILLENA